MKDSYLKRIEKSITGEIPQTEHLLDYSIIDY